jgi:hypothetical protein
MSAGDERTSVRTLLDTLWSAPPSGSEHSSPNMDRHDAGQRFAKARLCPIFTFPFTGPLPLPAVGTWARGGSAVETAACDQEGALAATLFNCGNDRAGVLGVDRRGESKHSRAGMRAEWRSWAADHTGKLNCAMPLHMHQPNLRIAYLTGGPQRRCIRILTITFDCMPRASAGSRLCGAWDGPAPAGGARREPRQVWRTLRPPAPTAYSACGQTT